MNARQPIPKVVSKSRIEDIPINESGDDVVTVEPGHGIYLAPAYHARGIASAPDEVRLRRRVLVALCQASAALPAGVDLLIWDGLRSLDTQQDIVDDFRASLPREGREETVERYLAPSPESEEMFRRVPPPHSTGGAVDLTLCDASSGEPLDMGAGFDQFDELSWLRYYENGAVAANGYAQRRRNLYWAMLGVGFSPYPWEYWHYELGTLVHAAYYGRPSAEYGPAVPWLPAR